LSASRSAADLSIVAPTYNERDRLADLVEAVFRAYAAERIDGELVIVDDNSPDGTGALAEDLARRFRVRVIHRAGKLGLGTAVVEGFEAAVAPIVGVIDADLSHPPQLLPRMFAVMKQSSADIVIGSRYIPGAGRRNWPLSRLIMSRLACLMARPLTPVRDATSGFFLIRRDLARGVRISAGGFKICLELLVRGQPSSIIEVPYVFEGRTAGTSKMNLREALAYVVQLRDLWRFQRSQARVRQRLQRLSVDQLYGTIPLPSVYRPR
jgi:dolichol-phosphate mannosyltransferase